MASYGGQYTVTASAVKMTTALGLTDAIPAAAIDIKAKSTNSGIVYIGPSTVTNTPTNARVALAAGDAWTSGPTSTHIISTNELYIVGTASDVVFIHIIS
jgi:hypothetical protein